MAMVTFSTMGTQLATQVAAVIENNDVVIVERSKKPAALFLSHDLWLIGQERTVDPVRSEPMGAREAQKSMKVVREKLAVGVHTVITVDARPKAVFAPYEWAREVFAELGLPQSPQPPPCALVVYRSPRYLGELQAEFAGTADPEWEMDRRLSAGSARILGIRRAGLRAVVYVNDGVVARVREVPEHGVWEDLPGNFSLVPVSPPLTWVQLQHKFPGLGIQPGDKRETRQGLWREYLDL